LRFLVVASLLASAPVVASAAEPLAAADQVTAMRRGVNIVGYDPLWKHFDKARFHERHFQLIHEAGFQTVRVNLQAFGHMNAQNQLDPAWLQTLDWVVKNALSNHLTVILDEHDFGYCAKHADTCRTKLLAFWEQVAGIYKDAPPEVVFEILNEPNGELTDELWNALWKDALAVVRKTSPTRNVVIGPGHWNSIQHLDQLELPEDDRHIIVTVHYYSPMEFTHQGAAWSKATAHLSGVTWGTDAEKKRVVDDFAGVDQWAKAHRRPILLGEFGAYDKGAMELRALYTAHVARTAESLGWAWTYWQFDSDFIVWDMAKDAWVEPILRALIPEAPKPLVRDAEVMKGR
jgi:endoglucanase